MIAVAKSRCLWPLVAACVALPLGAHCQEATVTKKRITAADAVRMTRLSDHEYFIGDSSQGRVGHFSPNGKQFIIVLRKGNPEQNTNEFSLLLFRTADVFHSPKLEL